MKGHEEMECEIALEDSIPQLETNISNIEGNVIM